MRKKMPTITESAVELLRRMKSEPDLKKRQRLHALYLVASGQARHRKDVAKTLGVHRHSVAAWFAAYAAGGVEHALRYDIPSPPPGTPSDGPRTHGPERAAPDPCGLCQLRPHPHLVGGAASGAVVVFACLRPGTRRAAGQAQTPTAVPRKKSPEAATQFPTALPIKLTQALAGNHLQFPVKVFAQDETRLGLQPILRRRITACGVQPVATVWQRFDNFYLFGAVEPTTGESFFLELPLLNSAMFQLWVDDFAQTFAASCNILVLDNGAFHTAKALRWPPNVAAVPFPPYSPELNPMERVWRDLKDKLADTRAQSLDALSDTACRLIQHYSQAMLKSLTEFAYFVQAVNSALQTANV